MEFLISLKSRCKARLFISDVDKDDDDDDRTCCKRCDELLATRDVFVLDFVVDDDELLFSICYLNWTHQHLRHTAKKKQKTATWYPRAYYLLWRRRGFFNATGTRTGIDILPNIGWVWLIFLQCLDNGWYFGILIGPNVR